MNANRMSAGAMLLAASVATGCATIGYRDVHTTDQPVSTVEEEVPGKGAAAEVKQTDSTATLLVAQVCDLREFQNVVRRVDKEAYNAEKGADYLVAVLGVAVAGAGAGVFVDSTKVYPKDENSRQYNPNGPDATRAAGIAGMAVGGALLLIPVIDAIRANGTATVTGPEKLPGRVLASGIPCKGKPIKAAVVGRAGDKEVPLGETDEQGKLAVDLVAALPAGMAGGAGRPEKMHLYAGDSKIGELSLGPVYATIEERVWKDSNGAACQNPRTSKDCNSVREYAQSFPQSRYKPEADRMLAEAAPKLARLLDDEAWKTAEPDRCANAQADEDCAGVNQYIDEFPSGTHLDEAKTALKKGKTKIAAARCRARCAPNCNGGADKGCMNVCMKTEKCQ